jgi:hypothetical protein
LKHADGSTHCADLQMATSSSGQQWVFSPRGLSCYLVPGFTPSMAQFVHNNMISKEVCRVFVLRYQSASHLTYPVSFHRVACHIQFIQSYKLHPYIHSCIHTIIHSYINTVMYSYIHIYTTYTQHHSHMITLVTKILFWSCLFSSVFTYHCVKPQVSTHEHLTFTSSLKVSSLVCLVQRCHSS